MNLEERERWVDCQRKIADTRLQISSLGQLDLVHPGGGEEGCYGSKAGVDVG
jgi:hypothetical protein